MVDVAASTTAAYHEFKKNFCIQPVSRSIIQSRFILLSREMEGGGGLRWKNLSAKWWLCQSLKGENSSSYSTPKLKQYFMRHTHPPTNQPIQQQQQ